MEWGLVVLSFSVAFLGSYAAITTCEQFRTCTIGITKSKYFHASGYLILMAVCLGGVGIWCMHFIGMSAMVLVDEDGHPVVVRFDIGMTMLSLVLVLVMAFAGLYVSSLDPVFSKHKRDIVEMFAKSSANLTINKASHMSHGKIVLLIATRAPYHLVAGGLVAGSGVVVMHYVGMAAMRFPGHIAWDFGVVAASIVIAFVASTAAFWILFRLLSLYANRESLRVACALTMACAVCGMHYTGMVAAKFHVHGHGVMEAEPGTMSDATALLAGILSAACVAFLCLLVSLADLRYSVHKLSNELYKADDLIVHMDVPAHGSCAHSIARYISKRKFEGLSIGILNEKTTIHHVLDDEQSNQDTDHSGSAVNWFRGARAALHHEDLRVHPSPRNPGDNSDMEADLRVRSMSV
jgi:NO-binding membrane sensor protein with MHYT domain